MFKGDMMWEQIKCCKFWAEVPRMMCHHFKQSSSELL